MDSEQKESKHLGDMVLISQQYFYMEDKVQLFNKSHTELLTTDYTKFYTIDYTVGYFIDYSIKSIDYRVESIVY